MSMLDSAFSSDCELEMSLTSRKVHSYNPFIFASPLEGRSLTSCCVLALVDPIAEGALLLYLHGQDGRVIGDQMLKATTTIPRTYMPLAN